MIINNNMSTANFSLAHFHFCCISRVNKCYGDVNSSLSSDKFQLQSDLNVYVVTQNSIVLSDLKIKAEGENTLCNCKHHQIWCLQFTDISHKSHIAIQKALLHSIKLECRKHRLESYFYEDKKRY